MRKRVISPIQNKSTVVEDWLPLEQIAQVEVTSEDAAHPVESALLPGQKEGWRAAASGVQSLRLLFDSPQPLQHIRLVFIETENARTQEFVLRYSTDNGQSFRDIVRQQWNFNPQGATREVEEYHVNLQDVTAVELSIIPNISGGDTRASLAELRVA